MSLDQLHSLGTETTFVPGDFLGFSFLSFLYCS